ncbi:MAG: phosphatase PAP2 family protein [Promethearchaeota archaeon]
MTQSNSLPLVHQFFRHIFYWLKNEDEKHELRINPHKKIEIISFGNLTLLAFGIFFMFYYTGQQYVEDPSQMDLIFDDPSPTIFLQKLGNPLFDIFFSYYYVFGMLSLLFAMILVFFGEEKGMWKYGLAFLLCWTMQYAIQSWVLNIAVPIRVENVIDQAPHKWINDYKQVKTIRADVWPHSEFLIGVKYGGLPSGHMGAPVMAYITSKRRNIRWLERYAIINGILIPICVIYLGEHYIIDLIASIVMYVIVFGGIVLIDETNKRRYLIWYVIIIGTLSPICIIYFRVFLGTQYIITLILIMLGYVIVVSGIVIISEWLNRRYRLKKGKGQREESKNLIN